MKRGSMHVDLTKTFFFFSNVSQNTNLQLQHLKYYFECSRFFFASHRESSVLATLHMKLLGVEVRSFKVTLPQKT